MITQIPTGHVIVEEYSRGQLETLSIGDYGRQRNVKADFLGYSRPIDGVPDMPVMPLSEKWVVTLSTQYGCPMTCKFCDVPSVGFRGNASFDDLYQQLLRAIRLRPDVRYTDRLNIHFARMGEPAFNPAVIEFARFLGERKADFQRESGLRCETIHPVYTTMCPRQKASTLRARLLEWAEIKNHVYRGQAGLQISVNSTSEAQRDEMFDGGAMSLDAIASATEGLPDLALRGKK